MSAIESAPLQRGVGAYIKKGIAWALFRLATFLNTSIGKACALCALLCTIAASAYWAHIILYPVLITIFGALWRRLIFYVIVRRISTRRRRWMRREWGNICVVCKRKWGHVNFWGRLALKMLAGTVIGMIVLHYLHIWSVAAYITAILPIPVFVEIYLGQKLPRIIAGFVQRQGVGKLVFDGGWKLVPTDVRFSVKTFDRAMTGMILSPRRQSLERAIARLEHIKSLRQLRYEESLTQEKIIERDLAAMND